MKKSNFILIILLLFIDLTLNAQTDKLSGCGTDELHFKQMKADDSYKRKFEANNTEWKAFIKKSSNETNTYRLATPIVLNIAFHDITSNASSSALLPFATNNITEYQYIVNKLNSIFNGINLVSSNSGNPTSIQFCLTQITDNGDVYDINMSRKYNFPLATELTFGNAEAIAVYSQSGTITSSAKNINVYIVDSIKDGSINNITGFATMPPAHGLPIDGIYIERNQLLNNTSLNMNMNTMAHEMGHYLGLFHTFGLCDPEGLDAGLAAQCACYNADPWFDGDMVNDTPPNQQQFTNYTCSGPFPDTCSGDLLPDDKENYMDYGDASCHSHFSPNQITRMQFMIDPVNGPRKSLRGQLSCVNCTDLNGCTFTISPNISLSGVRHELSQTGVGTPVVIFSQVATGCTNSLPTLTYSWALINLDNGSNVVTNQISATFSTPATLPVGNYRLEMTANQTATGCKETTFYNFVITPVSGVCPSTMPVNNNDTAWTNAGWELISFKGQWAIDTPSPLTYVGNVLPQHPGETDFINNGFDVVSLSSGAIPAGDPYFSGITLPTTANVTKVIRVGKIFAANDTSSGNAYYAKKTITINRNNCKFRIWYIGGTNGNRDNVAYPFHMNASRSDASFGFLSRYAYNSLVNPVAVNYNSSLGMDEKGDLPNRGVYSKNDMVALKLPIVSNGSSTWNLPTGAGFKTTNGWLYKDVDYSEFVAATGDSEITLTFFAHANTNGGVALQKAYAYFGIECLGGGIPENFAFDIDDIALPCQTNSNLEVTIPLPRPAYLQSYAGLTSYNQTANFSGIKIFKKNNLGQYINFQSGLFLDAGQYKLTLNQSDAPLADFRIFYKTIHQEVTDDFRVVVGYGYTPPATCSAVGNIDVNYYNTINSDSNQTNDIRINGSDILLCGNASLPKLDLLPTCIAPPYRYQWYRNGGEITGATAEDLQLAFSTGSNFPSVLDNYTASSCWEYERRTIFIDPYCGTEREARSQKFTVYNNQAGALNVGSVATSDFCIGSNYLLDVSSAMIVFGTCSVPNALWAGNTNVNNTFTFQLFDPNANLPIGNSITITHTGPITPSNPLVVPVMHFTFDNDNPGLPGIQPLWTEGAENEILLMVNGSYMGCDITLFAGNAAHPLATVNFGVSAIGGVIGFNCSSPEITNIDAGVTSGGYLWQSSTDGNTWAIITGAPSSANLPSAFVAGLGSGTLYIRRVSIGFGYCSANAFSNVALINASHPSTVIFSTAQLPASICNGGTFFNLPAISQNGIQGTWSPQYISLTASAPYVFTPLPGLCLPPYTYNLTVTATDPVPTFTQIPSICSGANLTLPTISNNNISGTWTPAVDNTTTTTYTFHPTTMVCPAAAVTMTVQVIPVHTPIFNINTTICAGSYPPLLPTTYNNGSSGSWEPASVNNLLSGTYTFTPTALCDPLVQIYITVVPIPCGPTLTWDSDVSCQQGMEGPKIELDIVDGTCIRVCENSTVTYHLNGNFGPISSTQWNITGGSLQPGTNNTTCVVLWNPGSFGGIQANINFIGGSTATINKCIEILEKPHALFGVMPDSGATEITVCKDNPVYFENLSNTGGGDDNLYYNWDFGDGTVSSEFEPTHQFEAGTYTVVLDVYNGCSCSDQYSMTVIVSDMTIPISCASVTCESAVERYSVPAETADNCTLEWEVEGGDIVGNNAQNTTIDVQWNNIGPEGFGYVSVLHNECFSCPTLIKVPVVQINSTITGSGTVCQDTQALYSLPKWPSTNFNWTLDDGGTGAVLINNQQWNEIIVNTALPGTLILRCTYFNTLRNCGGTAEFIILVSPQTTLDGPPTICTNTTTLYKILDSGGNILPGIAWSVSGPSGYSLTGSGNPFNLTLPTVGIYTIEAISAGNCSSLHTINAVPRPAAPTAVTGTTTVCAGIQYSYSCAPVAGLSTHWSVQNGTIIGSAVGNQVTVVFNAAVSPPLQLNVWYESDTCSSPILPIAITPDIPNLAWMASTAVVCSSSYVTYAIADIQAESYIWTLEDEDMGSVASGQNTNSVSILWNQTPGITKVKLKVIKCGIAYYQTFDVTIISSPVTTIVGPNHACVGEIINFSFSLNPGNVFGYAKWEFGDGNSEIVNFENNPNPFQTTHTYTNPLGTSTTYNISLTVYDPNGCLMPSLDTFSIIVSPSPVIYVTPIQNLNTCGLSPTSPDGIYNVNMQGGFASTNSITWLYSPTLNGTYATYSTGTPSINLSAATPGYYYAQVTNVYGCSADTRKINIFNDCACGVPYIVDAAVADIGCDFVKIAATTIQGTPLNIIWDNYNIPGANITTNGPFFEATGLEPGAYDVRLRVSYIVGSNVCYAVKNVSFVIPYKPQLKYEITCNNGLYQVTLKDHSVFWPGAPIQNYYFSVNGGNWIAGTPIAGIQSYITTLPPGTHTIGIKIDGSGYQSCQHTEPLLLDPMPNATFTATTNTCQGSAVSFSCGGANSTYTYHWDFGDFTENLQPNPSRVYGSSGSFPVTLTVRNRFGCSATTSQLVTVIPVDLDGTLQKTPLSTCQGSSITLHYNPQLSSLPQSIDWFLNNVNSVPIATTYAVPLPINLDYSVTQPGLYIAQPKAANGCVIKTIPGIIVNTVPIPVAPVISGTSIVCAEGSIDLQVPASPGVTYRWTVNNTPIPLWNGLHSIQVTPAIAGNYIYGVTASVSDGNGGVCTGPAGLFTVTVVVAVVMPQIALTVQTCDPYKVYAYVTNVQPGAHYYWSNGASGAYTVITHDGPIQVRAELNGCSASAQTNLPIDLQSVAWVFPTGCYANCDSNPLGYVIGPKNAYSSWSWMQNGSPVLSGTGLVNPFTAVVPVNDYQLFLDNGYCDLTIGTLSMADLDCNKCDITFTVKTIQCRTVNGQIVYKLYLSTTNPYSSTVYGSLSTPDGEGFFSPSTLTILPGVTEHIIYLYPLNAFNGGNVLIRMETPVEDMTCYTSQIVEFQECSVDERRDESPAKIQNVFVAAPNPSNDRTIISYAYLGNLNAEISKKIIEVCDLLGRKIVILPVNDTIGTIELDTSGIAAGQYVLLMKENGQVLANINLLVKH